MNRAFGLLLPDSDFTIEDAVPRLTAKFPQYKVALNGEQITISSPDWEIELAMNDAPEVLEDSVRIAHKIAGDDAGDLAEAATRVEVWSDTPDYELAHFADFLSVIEVLKSFSGVVAVNPEEPGLM